MRKPRHTAKRAYAELKAELATRRQEAATIVREAFHRKLARPGYVSKDTREFVEQLISEVEA